MNILILHRPQYATSLYHLAINHDKHNVYYMGIAENLADIPSSLRHQKIVRKEGEKTDESAIKYIAQSGIHFDRIISISEYELLEAATIREYFGILGQKTGEAIKVRNKVMMKTILQTANIKVPPFLKLEQLLDNKAMAKQLFACKKVVLKPMDGAGSADVCIFTNIDTLLQALDSRSTMISKLDRDMKEQIPYFEVEAFIEGDVYHLDGIVESGKLRVCQASRYLNTCLAYAQGFPLGSVQIPTTKELTDFAQKTIQALKIQDGGFHLECIGTGIENLYFLEIANRPGGGDIGKIFQMKTGIHLQSASVSAMLNEPITVSSVDSQSAHLYYGFFIFPGHHFEAEYCTIHNIEPFLKNPCLHEWRQLSATSKLTKHISYRSHELPFTGIVKGNSTEILEFMQEIFQLVKIEGLRHA